MAMLLMAIPSPARAATVTPVVAYPVSVPGAVQTFSKAIDGTGVVGQYSGSQGQGFYYDGSSYTTLAAPSATGATAALGISGDTIVGTFENNLNTYGFTYSISNQTWGMVTYPSSEDTYVNGIDGIRMVGSWTDGVASRGFFYDGSAFTSLSGDSLGAVTSLSANAIHGNVIGGSYDTSSGMGPIYAFLYEITTGIYSPFNLPFANVTSSFITGISGDWITGTYSDENNINHAFIYGRHSGEAWSVDAPNAVFGSYGGGVSGNNFVVNGFDGNGDSVSVVYTMTSAAVPEIDPAGMGSVLAFVAGALGLAERRRVRRPIA